jgi:hypothetical protein
MLERVVEKLPSVEDLERELRRNRRESHLLRSIQKALERKQVQERASEELRRRTESGVADGR